MATRRPLVIISGQAQELPSGDVLPVTKADVGLGSVTNDAQVPLSLVDAKGDLLVGTADNTAARLAVGANDRLLIADSAQASGLRWATPAEVKTALTLGNVDNTSNATERAASATLTNKTLTSPVINTPTGIVKGDVGLGSVDNTSNATERAATRTLTNARITKRVGTTASSSTPTADADAHDMYTVTAAAANMTFGAPTGTPTEFQPLVFRIKDNGTARTIAWNAIFRAVGVTLPTTTVISKTLYVGCWYNNADTKWDVLATGQEA